uniref:VLIG-type G domain-containing protein n=1 Tax=Astyanax mexicanus TaxID=7994 RepID=A0A8B9H0C9_ASTMX
MISLHLFGFFSNLYIVLHTWTIFNTAKQLNCLQGEDTHKTDDTQQSNEETKKHLDQLFTKLHLKGHQKEKLKSGDVLQVTAQPLVWKESCTEKELVQTFLQRLLRMGYRARKITNKETASEEDHVQSGPGNKEEDDTVFSLKSKRWKSTDMSGMISNNSMPVYNAENPMVAFFRIGLISRSKSKVINDLINEKHNTFFHRDCQGSSTHRLLMDGVVEIAWYCPSGKSTDHFTDCVAFCNLHGDAETHEKQLEILTEMSSVNVVVLDKQDNDILKKKIIQKLCNGPKPLVFILCEATSNISVKNLKYKIGIKKKGKADVSKNLKRIIKDCTSKLSSTFSLNKLGKIKELTKDENYEGCQKGKDAARQIMTLLEGTELSEMKESSLPHQGKLWREWCTKKKELHRLQGPNLEMQRSKTRAEMKNLHNFTTDDSAAFGTEHIFREMGQIYEACMAVQARKNDFSLPKLAAESMLSGHPLELMDGDTGHVPLDWVSAVLDELINKLGDQRVFVLSVLGIQSSGKSTMLNAMFGLQFAVSAGRCTKGAFMQLVKVSDELKKELNLDYIFVVDTEGLRSLELTGISTRQLDNGLATFVVGLGNMTLINIFGENPAEMQDILQIVVQAFMRMKKVSLNPRCMIVHQNVDELTAADKNMQGRKCFLD